MRVTFTIEPDGRPVKLTWSTTDSRRAAPQADHGQGRLAGNPRRPLKKTLEAEDEQQVRLRHLHSHDARPLWEALLKPEFTRQYFFGVAVDSDWKVGSPWKMTHADGTVSDAGEVIESDPPKRLVLKWRNK